MSPLLSLNVVFVRSGQMDEVHQQLTQQEAKLPNEFGKYEK